MLKILLKYIIKITWSDQVVAAVHVERVSEGQMVADRQRMEEEDPVQQSDLVEVVVVDIQRVAAYNKTHNSLCFNKESIPRPALAWQIQTNTLKWHGSDCYCPCLGAFSVANKVHHSTRNSETRKTALIAKYMCRISLLQPQIKNADFVLKIA